MTDIIATSKQASQAGCIKKNIVDKSQCLTFDCTQTNSKADQEVCSDAFIKYRDERSRYKNILKSIFLNNNFKVVTDASRKRQNQLEGHKSYAHQLKHLPRKQHRSSNIKVMLKTEYPIIHNLVHKYFYYKFYNKEDHFNDIFLVWMDTYVSEEFVKRIKSYQRINHFPNSCELGRKDLLSTNLKLAQKAMKQEYNFYPKTWTLPKQYDIFCEQKSKEKFYIVKPHANCQGRGIYLAKNPIFSVKEETIVQQYIDNPMLIDGCKFDLRIYVLLRSLDPLRIYVYKQGLCRLATSKYVKPDDNNFKNDKMHLTNYAINKWDPNFIANKDLNQDNKGHKRSYTSVIKYLAANGYDTKKIEERIDSIIVRTIMAAYTKMLKSYRKSRQNNTSYSPVKQGKFKDQKPIQSKCFNKEEPSVCFQLLGFDIMLLETGEPILLEINHQPSLIGDSPFDMAVKKSLLMDTINILNLDEKEKEQWEQCQRDGMTYVSKNMEEKQIESMGGYKCIYPLSNIKLHDKDKEQITRIQNYKCFYETILNKFLIKEFKYLSKVKLGNYRTIGSKVDTRRKDLTSKDQTISQEEFTPVHTSERSRFSRNDGSNEKHKAVALTFYNLFQDAKYHIKKGSASIKKCEAVEELEPEDYVIKNHVYLSEVSQPSNKRPKIKKVSKNPYIEQSQSKQKFRSKDELQLRDIFKETSSDNQPGPSFSSQRNVRETLTSIRNRGIMSYVASKKQKRQLEKKLQNDRQQHACNLSCEPLKLKGTEMNSTKTEKHNTSPEPSWKKLVITNHEPDPSKIKNEFSTRAQQYRNIYINSMSERVQKITSLKLNKKQYQKLNFASFLEKQKQQKNITKLKSQLQSDDKLTSPSAQ